jgi:hypothetical protein
MNTKKVQPQTYWNENILMHHWCGSKEPSEVAIWIIFSHFDRNRRAGKLLYKGIDSIKEWPLYTKPSPDEAMAKILGQRRE